MPRLTVENPQRIGLRPGEVCVLAEAALPGYKGKFLRSGTSLNSLRVGRELSLRGKPLFRALSRHWWAGTPSVVYWNLETEAELPPDQPGFELSVTGKGLSLAWITLSDKGARGEREDKAGPLIGDLCREALPLSLAQGFLIPDDERELKALLIHLALDQGVDLIVTTGGTGLAPRDRTPEATLAVLERRLPGFERAMTAASLQKTPHALISRAVAGTLGESLILNLPGSPKAVRECLEAVLPAVEHALHKLQGDPADCGTSESH